MDIGHEGSSLMSLMKMKAVTYFAGSTEKWGFCLTRVVVGEHQSVRKDAPLLLFYLKKKDGTS